MAVVTGAASGIGFALAERFASERMKVVLADVEASALARAEADLRAKGATVLPVRTDVSRPQDVEALAEKTLAAPGPILCPRRATARAHSRTQRGQTRRGRKRVPWKSG